MTRIEWVGQALLRGDDPLDKRAVKSGDAYPPYNILRPAPQRFQIVLAVAGFAEQDLTITIEDRRLLVRGRQPDLVGATKFLHRGIAARAFQREFKLVSGVFVEGASLRNGLLTIDLRHSRPAEVTQTISIKSGKGNCYE